MVIYQSMCITSEKYDRFISDNDLTGLNFGSKRLDPNTLVLFFDNENVERSGMDDELVDEIMESHSEYVELYNENGELLSDNTITMSDGMVDDCCTCNKEIKYGEMYNMVMNDPSHLKCIYNSCMLYCI